MLKIHDISLLMSILSFTFSFLFVIGVNYLRQFDLFLSLLLSFALLYIIFYILILGKMITCNLNMIKHDYSYNLRHKTLHLCACYHTLSAFLSFHANLCYNLKIH